MESKEAVMDAIKTETAAKQVIQFRDLGRIEYQAAWDYQENLFSGIINRKIEQRKNPDASYQPKHYLLFCEHPHVFTLGKSGSMKNLLINEEGLRERNISFFKINRGGDITYHGPGQIVGYPIIDLDYFFTDIGKYLRLLEESVILTLRTYGIEAGRSKGETGVWLEPESPSRARKICAIGVRCSRWVTMHGFAFNVNTDLSLFNYIIPCGITDKSVTSMQKELGRPLDMEEVKSNLKANFATLFNAHLFNEDE
ncbi:MAG: lipoyl(octanoyl) transferase LipB [Chitinophagaceae bacterium]|nr:lipoyl(octanoyl) transferase LipB [Chitinophagaceae bacterium]